MEMVLTGSMITAQQAERDGLVCRVVPNDKVGFIQYIAYIIWVISTLHQG
jgi:enoyl-CoA hydratase/carnithine racemase